MAKRISTVELAGMVAELTQAVNGIAVAMQSVSELSKRVQALENAKQTVQPKAETKKTAKAQPKAEKQLTPEQQAESDRIVKNNALAVFNKYVGTSYRVEKMSRRDGTGDFYRVKITKLLGEHFGAVNEALRCFGGRYNPKYKNFLFDEEPQFTK